MMVVAPLGVAKRKLRGRFLESQDNPHCRLCRPGVKLRTHSANAIHASPCLFGRGAETQGIRALWRIDAA